MFVQLDLGPILGIFAVAAAIIGAAGWKLGRVADELADRTGVGEAIAGALFLGATTSLSGTVTSVTAALADKPDLAISNAIGGIAAQTAFLGIADIVYRRANLEHAAASTGNLLSASLLVVMLCIPLAAGLLPPFAIFGVHPASLLLPATYVGGLLLMKRARERPMWFARRTEETREDVPEPASRVGLARLIVEFVVLAALVGAAGWLIAKSGAVISERTALTESAVGGVFTAVSTSLPELVTSVAAVRRGALTLAVGGIIGGNAFDVIFLAAADVAYRSGSIYHAMTQTDVLLIVVSLAMTGVLGMGLVFRQERGVARIGFESLLTLLIYAGLVVYLFAA